MTASPAGLDLTKVTPVAAMHGADDQETAGLWTVYKEASDYLRSFSWCQSIEEAFFGLGVTGVVGVFLFRLIPARKDVDSWVWVIVGDIPPAYITVEDAPNPASALDAYIGAMKSWAMAVREGRPVAEEIPVSAPATLEFVEMLESRLRFLDQEILSSYASDLQQDLRT